MSTPAVSPAWIAAHPLACLIPHINPQFAGKSGIEAALGYRLALRAHQAQEIDSAPAVKAAYRLCFGADDAAGCADTVLNAFMPFLDFCNARLTELGYQTKPQSQKIVLPLVQQHFSAVFSPEYDTLRTLFDTYFDRMYCFGNLMPAPSGLNNSPYGKGKGDWKLNRDYPAEYLKNLHDPDCNINRKAEITAWLTDALPRYCLTELYCLPPPYPITQPYTADKRPALESFIRQAVAAVEKRAEQIRKYP